MTRILADTNVVLDVLLNRIPHVKASLDLLLAIDAKRAEGFIAAHAVTTIHYHIRKGRGATDAAEAISSILRVFRVATVDDAVIRQAVHSKSTDFEDAVTAAAAEAARCEVIVTRDPKGFRHSPIPAMAPEEALRLLSV